MAWGFSIVNRVAMESSRLYLQHIFILKIICINLDFMYKGRRVLRKINFFDLHIMLQYYFVIRNTWSVALTLSCKLKKFLNGSHSMVTMCLFTPSAAFSTQLLQCPSRASGPGNTPPPKLPHLAQPGNCSSNEQTPSGTAHILSLS